MVPRTIEKSSAWWPDVLASGITMSPRSGGGGPIHAVWRRPARVANIRFPCVSMTPLARPVVPEV